MFRSLAISGLLLMATACSQPARNVPLTAVASARPSAAESAQDLSAIVDPCAQAMDGARGAIGQLAASGQPNADGRAAVTRTKMACQGAFASLQKIQAPGQARDACLSAVYTRETLADTAIAMLDGKAGALAVTTLKYKADDQSAADRACTTALASLGGRDFAMVTTPLRQ